MEDENYAEAYRRLRNEDKAYVSQQNWVYMRNQSSLYLRKPLTPIKQ